MAPRTVFSTEKDRRRNFILEAVRIVREAVGKRLRKAAKLFRASRKVCDIPGVSPLSGWPRQEDNEEEE